MIEGADALKVTIEGEEYDADIIGSDPSSDIAVIKAKNASGLTAMELGDSDDLTVGSGHGPIHHFVRFESLYS